MDELTTLIHFNVPLHYKIHEFDLANDDTQTLLKAIAPIIREAKYTAWGRVQTQPEMTVILSVWPSAEKYTDFIESSEGKHFLLVLGSLSSIQPESDGDKGRGGKALEPLTIAATFGNLDRVSYRQPLYPHTQIRLVFFPTPTADDKRDIAIRHTGPSHKIGFGSAQIFEAQSAYYRSPRRGWCPWPIVRSTLDRIPGEVETKAQPGGEREGASCDVMVALMTWRSKEKEQDFRDKAVVIRKDRGLVPVFEDWEDALKSQGAFGWKDYYVDFQMVDKDIQRKIKMQYYTGGHDI
ncbi:hypothetical protein F5Y13DRAFT_159294 [Hypoxylon sp. FL1857]|nr:hypothetical protein F5Y13DRAFT_159294 [Hypoxylon sp. FL1857]